ncbi:hypothetical protein EKN56_14880 [Limnobaculum zhutongyuii]|uniref:Copper-binding protein n=1 Tax=Limnobaculum zhutongyuii TaxID=2498113 RepID=A0A411WMU9_9GAMM|nr:hypothetical protein [Limnobaculum zhutongyuii]QBH97571.1 hypothetical protein EKN56_14880 [Limnobaculum zhutongyuii]TQS91046.1 hypothetical protein ELQ32_01600 [Limnobaculum zhutongyuii]
MTLLSKLIKTTAALSFLTASIFSAQADTIPLSGNVQTELLVAKVVSVDQSNHVIVLSGKDGEETSFQLTDRAKDLEHVKTGDMIEVTLEHSVAVALETDVNQAAPIMLTKEEVSQATKDNPTPNANALRQVNISLKITHIDLKKHQITFEGPAGRSKVVSVKKPEVQARLKDLKVGQSVQVTYTDLVKITADHGKK